MSINLDLKYQEPAPEDYQAYPENAVDTTSISAIAGIGKYGSGIKFGRFIFLAPNRANNVGIIDTVNKTIDTTTIPAPAGIGKWSGIVPAWNNKAYLIPFRYPAIGILDMVNLTLDVTTMPINVPPFNQLYSGGYLAPNNGCIYCPAFNADAGVLKINPFNDTFSTFGQGFPGQNQRWAGAVLSSYNGLGYCAPFQAPIVGIINSFNDTYDVTTITGVVGGQKYSGGAEGADQNIYFAPNNAGNVLILDPTTDTIDTTTIVGFSGYTGGRLAANKKIYMAPTSPDNFLIVDTDTQTADNTTISGLPGVSSFFGATCTRTGELFGTPFSGDYVPIIRTGFPEISLDYCTSAYNNN